jgi:hypothetical protein
VRSPSVLGRAFTGTVSRHDPPFGLELSEATHPGVTELADAGGLARAARRSGHLGEWPD